MSELADNSPKFVVGIGASAGGLDAIEALFQEMPIRINASYVVIQHLSPDFKSLMDEILPRHTQIPVVKVENGMKLESDQIYLIPPRSDMILSGGKLFLTEQEPSEKVNLPIDKFFKSLAEDCGENAVAVVLSGSGSDGSRGIRDVEDAGGLVLVQDFDTAKFDSMPRAAAQAAISSARLCDPRDMPKVMLEWMADPHRFEGDAPELDVTGNESLNKVFRILNNSFGVNFAYYKATTIDRRLERRMQILGIDTLEEYADNLSKNISEVHSLYEDLLIGVTKFFRDTGAFEELKNKVFPQLLETAKESKELRVWVPGCATGEEPYSIAILLNEFLSEHQAFDIDVKIFATDIYPKSLETAGAGIYSKEQLAEVPQNLISRYFVEHEQGYQISTEIRKMVVFASQNITTDPPFTRIDLLSCRNLLIYLQSSVQKKVMSLFHFALKTGGFMFLGTSESVGAISDELEIESSTFKIFSKRRDKTSREPVLPMMFSPRKTKNFRTLSSIPTERSVGDPLLTWAYESLIGEVISSGFLLDEDRNLLYIHGDARQLLRIGEGRLSSQINSLVAPALGVALSSGIHRAETTNKKVTLRNTKVEIKDEEVVYDVTIQPLFNKKAKTSFFFCGFAQSEVVEEHIESMDFQHASTTGVGSSQYSMLEQELQYAKESLQAANEELETSNEELQATNEELLASNEELQSTNEELQSTNEELQSTNEELHSVNEELHTVNTEYQEKISELREVNTDVENLLKGTEIGTVFLDQELRIRKFTPAVSQHLHLLERDIGRPLEHFAHNINLEGPNLKALAKQALDEGILIEKEVGVGKKSFLMRILPYRDQNLKINGVVVTITDITTIKVQQRDLQDIAERLDASNRELQDFAYSVSHDLQSPVRHLRWQVDEVSYLESEDRGKLLERIGNLEYVINNLLEYARIQTKGADFAATDTAELVSHAIDSLGEKVRNSEATINVSDLPTVLADKGQLVKVFTNLIDNSIKFRGERIPEINITAEQKGSAWLFRVNDNGIGINARSPEEKKRLFLIFTKGETDYPGAGVGLSVVKRIIERHGGEVWFESTPGEGSTFYFTLPVDPPKSLQLG